MARSHRFCGFGLEEVSPARLHILAFAFFFYMSIGIEGVGIKRRLAEMEKGEDPSASGASSSAGHASSSASSAPKAPKKGIASRVKAVEESLLPESDPRGPLFERLKLKWAEGKMSADEVQQMAMASERQGAWGMSPNGFYGEPRQTSPELFPRPERHSRSACRFAELHLREHPHDSWPRYSAPFPDAP